MKVEFGFESPVVQTPDKFPVGTLLRRMGYPDQLFLVVNNDGLPGSNGENILVGLEDDAPSTYIVDDWPDDFYAVQGKVVIG